MTKPQRPLLAVERFLRRSASARIALRNAAHTEGIVDPETPAPTRDALCRYGLAEWRRDMDGRLVLVVTDTGRAAPGWR